MHWEFRRAFKKEEGGMAVSAVWRLVRRFIKMPRIPIRASLTSLNAVKHFCETMRTASVRDLRQNFPAVMRWIKEGENVAITMRRKIVARLIPERPPITRTAPAPDFDLIAQRIFGSQKFGGNLADLERQG